MRIATSTAYDSAIANLQQRLQQLTTAQSQLTSGQRVQRASDDPAAAAQAERALAWQARVAAEQRAIDASRLATQLTESALGSAGELLQQARERLVEAGNGSYGDSERASLAQSLKDLREQLLALANSSDGSRRYLFGGQGVDRPPLEEDPSGVVQYVGTSGAQRTATSETSPLTMDGSKVWLQAPDPANPGGTLSVFDVLDQAIADLATPGRSSAQTAQTVATGLGQIDAVAQHLGSKRSEAGQTLQRIDAIGERLAQAGIDAQEQRSTAQDLDLLQTLSDFQSRQSGYDAALQSYAMVQRLSLFQYLG